jgi:hypothetical protein
VPDPAAEAALVELCHQRGLFRLFDHGPLRGRTLTPELLRDLLAEARLDAAPAATLPPAVGAGARLIARAGDGRATIYPLRAPETTIGRGADNDVIVASDHVSRYHARVSWDGRQYVVEDLGSKNGTFVAGEPVTARRPLRHGDRVALAGATPSPSDGRRCPAAGCGWMAARRRCGCAGGSSTSGRPSTAPSRSCTSGRVR